MTIELRVPDEYVVSGRPAHLAPEIVDFCDALPGGWSIRWTQERRTYSLTEYANLCQKVLAGALSSAVLAGTPKLTAQTLRALPRDYSHPVAHIVFLEEADAAMFKVKWL